MKKFTNWSIKQKILIVLITAMLITFSIPKPVQADFGGTLMSPVTGLITGLLDGVQSMLEWAMLGETSDFMKTNPKTAVDDDKENPAIEVPFSINFGAQIPNIQYTPEAIFSNRVPALDVNFINPSVKTADNKTYKERNVAYKLRPTIASWYVAIRTLALVGLMSVLIYLGIRMLLTSVAADKAKYKQMLTDWLVAMCLLFILHYIMSFALTMSETLTALVSESIGTTKTIVVTNKKAMDGPYQFEASLMNYVRFMIQASDLKERLIFIALYLMLVIYSARFTWTYLKRVVNMAFLTLIAPFVALTYPIDKVSDGKAQAFDMWVKEFTFNALIQPLHLLLYIILLGSATELAIQNPLYAIVALGFILTGEKLLKQMFGFNKAGAGTVGSLAGAAGVSAFAANQLMKAGKGALGGGKDGGSGKIRTKGQAPQRVGKDSGATSGLGGFNNANNQGLESSDTASNSNNAQSGNEGQGSSDTASNINDAQSGNEGQGTNGEQGENEINPPGETLDDLEQQRAELYNQGYTDNSDEIKNINERIQSGDFEQPSSNENGGEPNTSGSPNPRMTEEGLQNIGSEEDERTFSGTVREDWNNFKGRVSDRAGQLNKDWLKPEGWKARKKRVITGVRNNAIGAWKAAPSAIYKGARSGLKLAARGAAGLALGATAGVIGATTGDGDKAISMAASAFAVGAATGDDIFEGIANKVGAKDVNVKDKFNSGRNGNAIDIRNAKADKEYIKSDENKEEYEKYFKDGDYKMSRKEYDKAVLKYRQSDITDAKTIRKGLMLEKKYNSDPDRHDTPEEVRNKVIGIASTQDKFSNKAIRGTDEKERKAAVAKIEAQLTEIKDAKQKQNVVNEIFKGYQDWDNML